MNQHITIADSHVCATQEVRVVGTKHSLQGVERKVAIGQRYYWVGAITFGQLQSGYSPDELELFEIDPDAEEIE